MYFPKFLAALVLSSVLVLAGCSSPSADSRPQPKPAPSSLAESLGPKESPEPGPVVKQPKTIPQPPSTAPVKKVSKAPAAAKTRSAEKPPEAPNAETIAAVAPPAPPAPLQPPLESTPAVPEPKLAAPEPTARQIIVPSGTLIAVRMIDSVDSESGHVGQTFKASLDAPITVDNETVFPIGAEAYVKLTKVQSAGNLKGKSELQLQLDRIFLGRKSYTIETNTYDTSGAAQGAKTARTAVIGAAIGTAIGAITGGGKGAVIGGATGAGAGVGIEAVTKGEQVRVDSETRLDFRLEQPLEVTAPSASPIDSSHPRDSHSGPLRLGTRPN